MKKQEMKVFTKYEGWDAENERRKRSTLVKKTMLAEMETSAVFHEKREAYIRKKYAADEIDRRILNGDGGSWTKEPYDRDTILQLDRYYYLSGDTKAGYSVNGLKREIKAEKYRRRKKVGKLPTIS